jgi:hypothetical protein
MAAGPGIDTGGLLEGGDWSAVPATLPVVALAFVYHNVVPVVVQALEADVGKVRTAICAGVAIPWVMFVSWEAAILGSIGALQSSPAAAEGAATDQLIPAVQDQGQQRPAQQQQKQQQSAQPLSAVQDARGGSHDRSSSSSRQLQGLPAQSAPELAAGTASSSSSSSTPARAFVPDPLAVLQAGNQTVGPLIQGFSLLAIATSFIGFILGLTDFLVDGLKLPDRQAPLPYALTLLPPFAIAVTNPDIFLQALDTAGEMHTNGRRGPQGGGGGRGGGRGGLCFSLC